MARERSTNRTQALKLWLKSGRKMLLKEIGAELGVSDVMIRKWKFLDKWDEIPEKRPRGGQKGNQNAVGNSGGLGGPLGNDKAVTHSLFRKFMPQDAEYLEIMDMVEQMDPLDMIWHTVEIAFTKLIRSQRIMFVQDQEDITKEIKKKKMTFFGGEDGGSADETEWEIQFAWDKHATDIKTHSLIMRELRSAIKQFLSMAPENDERRLKLEHMQVQIDKAKAEIDKINGSNKNTDAKDWADAITEVAAKRKAKGKES